MSYLVLARKYRPNNFDEVIGQAHITELLQKAIASNRIAHSFLFCGPRGIGKTSCARILAKSLNCQEGPTPRPCGTCPACREIAQGNSFDVLEIDGASNRGIDEIRTLRENVKFAPTYGAYKVYIVDEVHMLTTEAFNALLKTLEEPPAHVIFIFATTDPNKVPTTIISRCQRYDFKRITLKAAVKALGDICKKEKFDIEQDALYAIAKAAQGSFRDALSILDQVGALSERHIKGEDVYNMLGLVELDRLFDLAAALQEKDCARALKIFDEIIDSGKDIKQLSRDLIEHFRNMMVLRIGGKSLGRLVDYPIATKELYLTAAGKFSLAEILRAIDTFVEAQETARVTETLRIPLEVAFAKLTFTAEGRAPAAAAQNAAPLPPETACGTGGHKFSPAGMLKNQKGQVNVPAENYEETDEPEENGEGSVPDPLPPGGGLDLEKIRKGWSALTSAVSRKKMFLASYLQEGTPVEFNGERLTVGFAKEQEFHKESLEHDEYRLLVEGVLSEHLRQRIVVEYKVIEDLQPEHQEADEPQVKTVLETFQGRIVSKWHNE